MDNLVETSTRQGSFKGKDDYNIAYRVWAPAGAPRAVMLVVPGFNSHSGYYGWVGTELAGLGFISYGVDLRGRGKSDGERFYVKDIEDYVADVKGVMDIAKAENPGLPVYVLGHSAGGVVSCVFTLENQAALSGLVCMSFAYQVPAPDFAIAALKGLAHVFPHAHVLPLANKNFSRDPAAVARMDADPLIAHETQPSQTIAALAMADDRLKQSFGQITVPVLIMHGTKDLATKYQGSQYFFDHAGSADKTLKLYDGHYHDMLNDLGKEEVMGDIKAWLQQHLG